MMPKGGAAVKAAYAAQGDSMMDDIRCLQQFTLQ